MSFIKSLIFEEKCYFLALGGNLQPLKKSAVVKKGLYKKKSAIKL